MLEPARWRGLPSAGELGWGWAAPCPQGGAGHLPTQQHLPHQRPPVSLPPCLASLRCAPLCVVVVAQARPAAAHPTPAFRPPVAQPVVVPPQLHPAAEGEAHRGQRGSPRKAANRAKLHRSRRVHDATTPTTTPSHWLAAPDNDDGSRRHAASNQQQGRLEGQGQGSMSWGTGKAAACMGRGNPSASFTAVQGAWAGGRRALLLLVKHS